MIAAVSTMASGSSPAFAQGALVEGKITCGSQGVRVVLTQDPAAAVQSVPVQVAGSLRLAQLAQVGGQVTGGAQGVGVVLA